MEWAPGYRKALRGGTMSPMPRLTAVVRRLPLTSGLVAVIILLSIVTRTLWDPLAATAARCRGHVWPAGVRVRLLVDGRDGRVLRGAALQYLPILLGLMLFGGFAEWRLGTLRYAIALVSCHVLAVVGPRACSGSPGIMATCGHVPCPGPRRRPSAGFLGAAAAASVTLTPPWRGRLRAGLVTYVVLFAIHMGSLADLEHVIGVAWGLALGPLMFGRAPTLTARQLTRRDYRLLASGFFVIAAVEVLIRPFTTAEGRSPRRLSAELRAQELADRDLVAGFIQAVLWFWLARSLYKGRRRAWRWAVGLLVLVMGIQVASLITPRGRRAGAARGVLGARSGTPSDSPCSSWDAAPSATPRRGAPGAPRATSSPPPATTSARRPRRCCARRARSTGWPG